MTARITKITLMITVSLVLVLGLASAALASSWIDLSDVVLAGYGVSGNQVSEISSGYPDGTFRPYRGITRAEFAKMADAAFDIEPANPVVASFSDVASTNFYYQYIEGAHAAGLMDGIGAGLFAPETGLTREQAMAVIARGLATAHGYDLADLPEAQIAVTLGDFADASSVSAALRAEMAYAVMSGVTQGNDAGNLAPQAAVSRIVAAALLIRAGSAPATPIGETLALVEADNGKSYTVEVGDFVQVTIPGNPTTGYQWMAALSDDDAALLQMAGAPAYVPDSTDELLVGVGGKYTFTFRAVAAGEATLKLIYARSWEDVDPLQTFTVTVTIE